MASVRLGGRAGGRSVENLARLDGGVAASPSRGDPALLPLARRDNCRPSLRNRSVLGSANTLTNILERPGPRKSAFYTLLLLLATTMVTGLFVWRFTRPIKSLSIAARSVAGGDFGVRVPKDRLDEMGALAAAFNEMTASSLRALASLKLNFMKPRRGQCRQARAAIADEIRNPLNYINLTLDHLRSSLAPEDPVKRATFQTPGRATQDGSRAHQPSHHRLPQVFPALDFGLQPVDLRRKRKMHCG